jgi:hypothetical protein
MLCLPRLADTSRLNSSPRMPGVVYFRKTSIELELGVSYSRKIATLSLTIILVDWLFRHR